MNPPKELLMDEPSILDYTIKWVKDYFKPFENKKAIVGLSGGSDSTLTAYICQKALGKDNVFGLIMPAESTPEEDVKDAEEVAAALGIKWRKIDINKVVKDVEDLDPEVTDEKNRVTRANIKARLRMLLLYMEANKTGAIVAGTDDRSEHYLGYYTKYGDGGVDINVPEHLYKTQVIQLLSYIGENERLKIFTKVAKKPPSPQLWKGQTAENELNVKYEDIDRVLYNMNEKGFKEAKKLAEKTDIGETQINHIISIITGNKHKNMLPPSPPVTYFNKKR